MPPAAAVDGSTVTTRIKTASQKPLLIKPGRRSDIKVTSSPINSAVKLMRRGKRATWPARRAAAVRSGVQFWAGPPGGAARNRGSGSPPRSGGRRALCKRARPWSTVFLSWISSARVVSVFRSGARQQAVDFRSGPARCDDIRAPPSGGRRARCASGQAHRVHRVFELDFVSKRMVGSVFEAVRKSPSRLLIFSIWPCTL